MQGSIEARTSLNPVDGFTYEVLSEEGLAIIEHNAETILQEIGIDFKEHPRATALLKQAGCDRARPLTFDGTT